MKAFLKSVAGCILGVACLAALLAPQSAEAKGYLQMDETCDTAHLNYEGHGLMLEKIEPFLLGL